VDQSWAGTLAPALACVRCGEPTMTGAVLKVRVELGLDG
jgi:hypothetical protein